MQKAGCNVQNCLEADVFQQYKQLFDSLQEGFAVHEIICDEANRPIDYRFLAVNPAFEELTGRPRNQLLGKTVREVLPATEDYWIQNYGEVALTGQPQRFEAFSRALGRHYSIYAYCPQRGRFATLFLDVTERIRMEEALHDANEKLEEKVRDRTRELDIASETLIAQNEELSIQNEEITAMNEEIRALNQSLEGLTEDLEQRVIARTADLCAAHQETNMRFEQLKRTEKALTESEAKYRAVIEQAPEAVLICDPDTGEILEANTRFAEQFGYDFHKHGTMNLYELIADEPEKCRALMLQGAQSGRVPLQRGLFHHHNGSLVSVERSATLVSYRGRRLFVMTLRDVSEEVRREQQIDREARQAIRVQKAMLPVLDPSDYLDITTVYHPIAYVGGDLYFLNWRYGGKLLRGFLVDATGHGLGTALHTASMHVLIREVNERDLPLSVAMRWLNRRVGEYFDEGTFAGALGFEFDLELRQLHWICAGIPKILVSTKTQQCAVDCPGMCLGISEDETFEMHTLPIEIGECFYFLTDGLTDLLHGMSNLPLDRHSAMLDLLCTLSKSPERRDDATAVCIQVRALPQALVRQDGWPRTLRFNGYGDYQRLKEEVGKILAEVTGKAHSIHEVSVHEALANALECRDGAGRQHKARLRFNKVGNRLIVRVKTSRLGFAGNAILRRLRSHPEDMFSFGEDASMGRGIPMMLSMADRMTYNSEGTEVLLAWNLTRMGTDLLSSDTN